MKINEVNYKWNGSLAKRNKTDMIVLHHADAKECTVQDVHQWHLSRGWLGVGYHYFIRRNGSIYRGRPENTIGSHAVNYNSNSIGVCFEGDYTVQTMPKAQLEAGKELIAYLKEKYQITKVKGHGDLMATDCPGAKFPFKEIVNSSSKENLILLFQQAAKADGFKFPKYGCDGQYGSETKAVMEKCVVKKRDLYKYKNATKLVQKLLDVKQDGLCGNQTSEAIKAFQKKRGLVVDGAVGFNTWAALLKV